MPNTYTPVRRPSLADDLAQRLKRLIDEGGYAPGDRLPTIAALAARFDVGPPTLREALKKLETVGMVRVRHGSGLYVGDRPQSLFVSNPVAAASAPSRKTLLDLIEARIPLEVQTVALAARHATPEHLTTMRALLDRADALMEDDGELIKANMAFHRAIATASGNEVLDSLLDLVTNLFRHEQQAILRIHGSRRQDHAEHLEIFDALADRDEALAVERMRAHLEGVRQVLLRSEGNGSA